MHCIKICLCFCENYVKVEIHTNENLEMEEWLYLKKKIYFCLFTFKGHDDLAINVDNDDVDYDDVNAL